MLVLNVSRAGARRSFSLCLKPRSELCCLMAKAKLALSQLKTVTVRICDLAEKTVKLMKREGFLQQQANRDRAQQKKNNVR